MTACGVDTLTDHDSAIYALEMLEQKETLTQNLTIPSYLSTTTARSRKSRQSTAQNQKMDPWLLDYSVQRL